MSDLDLGAHGAPVAGGLATITAIVTAFLARFFALRKQEAAEKRAQEKEDLAAQRAESMLVRLALIEQRLGDVLTALKDHQQLALKVGLLERDVQAIHDRLDGRRAQRVDP